MRKIRKLRELAATSVLLLVVADAGVGSNQARSFEILRETAKHRAKVVIKTRPFDRTSRRVGSIKKLDLPITTIDGRIALGTDGDMPRVEIASMQLFLDGTEIPIPKKLYSDCFEPNFGKEYLALTLSDDGDSVLIFMAGGDAAGGYQVYWTLRKDGHHSKFSNPCSDCDYTGTLSFLADQFPSK